MSSNPQPTPDSTKPDSGIEMKSSPPQSGLTGKGYASGLLMTGVVIVGSWMGMAAYVDYRLQGVEQQFHESQKEIVTQVNEGSNSLESQLIKRVNETSSVLAQGILDIGEKADKGFEETQNKLASTATELKKDQAQTANQIKTYLSEAQDAVVKQFVSSQQSLQKSLEATFSESQSQQSESLQTAIAHLQKSDANRSGEILSAVKTVSDDVQSARSSLNDTLNSSLKSLTELVNNVNINQREEFKQLAAGLGGLSEQTDGKTSTLENQLQGLATQAASLFDTMKTLQGGMDEIQAVVPQIRGAYEAQWTKWSKQSEQTIQTLTDQLTAVSGKLNELDNNLDSTAESVMNAVFLGQEGLEGTRIELKSDLVTTREQTAAKLNDLSESLQTISTDLKSLHSDIDAKQAAAAQPQETSRIPVEAMKTVMAEFNKTLSGVKDALSNALLPNLERMTQDSTDGAAAETVGILKEAVGAVETLIGETGEHMKALDAPLEQSDSVADASPPATDSQDASMKSESETANKSPTQHPEHRSEDFLGFRLY